jgi:hypothetical protein
MFRASSRAIFANLRTKLLALAIAVAIWSYADSQLTDSRTVTVPLELKPPPGYVLLAPSDEQVDLTIAGPRSLLSRLTGGRKRLTLDYTLSQAELPSAEGGLISLDIAPQWLKHGLQAWEILQLDVREIKPISVNAFASPVISKPDVPVEVLSPWSRIQEIRCEPDHVTVSGPAVAVEDMGVVLLKDELIWSRELPAPRRLPLQTEVEVKLDRELTNLDRDVTLTIPIECSPPTVTVEPVEREETPPEPEPPATHVFRKLPVMFLVPPDSPYRFKLAEDAPRHVSVLVRAPREDIDWMMEAAGQPATDKGRPFMLAYVDLCSPPADMAKGDPFDEQVKVRLPAGVTAMEVKVLNPDNEDEPLQKVNIIVEDVVAAVPDGQ